MRGFHPEGGVEPAQEGRKEKEEGEGLRSLVYPLQKNLKKEGLSSSGVDRHVKAGEEERGGSVCTTKK